MIPKTLRYFIKITRPKEPLEKLIKMTMEPKFLINFIHTENHSYVKYKVDIIRGMIRDTSDIWLTSYILKETYSTIYNQYSKSSHAPFMIRGFLYGMLPLFSPILLPLSTYKISNIAYLSISSAIVEDYIRYAKDRPLEEYMRALEKINKE